MKPRQKQINLTEGSVWKVLFKLSLPLLLTSVLQAMYGTVDMLVVGNFLDDAMLSAVSVSSQVMQILTASSIGFGVAGTVLVAKGFGAGKTQDQKKQLGTIFTLSFLIAVILMILIGFLLNRPILALLKVPQEAFEGAVRYLGICGIGMVFIFGYNIICAVLRGIGDTVFPLIICVIAALVNLGLDLLFLPAMKLGISGAASATVIAQVLAMVIALIYLYRKSPLQMPRQWRDFAVDPAIAKDVFRVGIPSALQITVVYLSMLLVMRFVNSYGVVVSAAYGIGLKVDNFATLPRQAVANSTVAIVGQNAGAQKEMRIRKTVGSSVLMSVIVCCIVAAVVWIFAPWIARIFTQSPDVIVQTVRYLRIISFGYPILGIMGSMNALPIGLGFTMFTLFTSFTDSIIVRVPLCYLLGQVLMHSCTGIYIGAAIAPASAVALEIWYYFSGRWRKRIPSP